MIQLEAIHIEEFRGIRKLDLKLDCKSFVVHGPNGSGKSGVVDAIGFAITGTISRLSGPGTGGLTVLRHGPHVHRRDDPAAAKVSLTIRDTTTGKSAVLSRTIKAPGSFTLTPDTTEMREALRSVQDHPELTLSRREIIKFILAESGKRAAEVQALLKLEGLEERRKTLKTTLSLASRDVTGSKASLEDARDGARRHFDVADLDATEIMKAANKRRDLLKLTPLQELSLDTDFKQGLEQEETQTTFNKASATRDVEALVKALAHSEVMNDNIAALRPALSDLASDVTILEALQQREFVASGLDLVIDAAVCPLCDTAWENVDALRQHLQEKIARSDAAAALQKKIMTAGTALIAQIRSLRGLVRATQPHALAHGDVPLQLALEQVYEDFLTVETALGSPQGALGQKERVDSDLLRIPADLQDGLAGLIRTLRALPDNSARVDAQSYLVLADERWSQLRLAKAKYGRSMAVKSSAQTIYDAYCKSVDTALTNLYETVEGSFSEFYRQINSDDEAAFKAELGPSSGKLDLVVDFYGLGMFPPGAYHSEGHQDGMGVCLYLALVKQLLGDSFRFAVLDDVVMSVDSNHRRQFCELLKERFPDVQFVITTHDEIWAKQMQSSGLISRTGHARFYGWNVNEGPAAEQGVDLWDRIDADLAKDDVAGAAHKLRRGLEAIMTDLAEALRARVAYKGDAKYELGELLGSVTGRHGDWLSKAAKSANSWGNAAAKQSVEELKDSRSKAVLAQQNENWAVNALVHYNEWASMSKADFVPVVKAWRQFLELFQCDNAACESWIYVSGAAGKEETLRCDCGVYNLNLVGK
ncbi:AAA domain-containing protein [Blastococcus colisei]|uniref:AAA domain-containing protein n=1 Tax=Blastococcus colisei TaxID=1564162 RepID=A0A543PC83_9ACTN|nr:AAA family ATPase [Blastococcus colisei]TQN41674.1 AAA domain-containing protein [Blastococcus colisei]